MNTKFLLENVKGTGQLDDLCIDGRIRAELILNKKGVDWNHLGQGSVQ
jgi:hypothetical protein